MVPMSLMFSPVPVPMSEGPLGWRYSVSNEPRLPGGVNLRRIARSIEPMLLMSSRYSDRVRRASHRDRNADTTIPTAVATKDQPLLKLRTANFDELGSRGGTPLELRADPPPPSSAPAR